MVVRLPAACIAAGAGRRIEQDHLLEAAVIRTEAIQQALQQQGIALAGADQLIEPRRGSSAGGRRRTAQREADERAEAEVIRRLLPGVTGSRIGARQHRPESRQHIGRAGQVDQRVRQLPDARLRVRGRRCLLRQQDRHSRLPRQTIRQRIAAGLRGSCLHRGKRAHARLEAARLRRRLQALVARQIIGRVEIEGNGSAAGRAEAEPCFGAAAREREVEGRIDAGDVGQREDLAGEREEAKLRGVLVTARPAADEEAWVVRREALGGKAQAAEIEARGHGRQILQSQRALGLIDQRLDLELRQFGDIEVGIARAVEE